MVKITKHDKVFSLLVRGRAEWRCEYTGCGKHYPPPTTALHCSHNFGRRTKSNGLRWHPLNAAALCYGHHSFLGANPTIFKAWIEDHLGEEQYNELLKLKQVVRPMKKHDLEDIYAHLKYELSRMNSMRDLGVTGRIEFPPWVRQ